MPLAKRTDEKLVVDILATSFENNPSVLAAIKQSKSTKPIRELARYAFKTAIDRNGVYLSTDQTAVAICYNPNLKKEGMSDYIRQVRLVFNSIGVSQVMRMMKKEAYIKEKRPKQSDYLYFWFFGSSTKGNGSAKQLSQEIIDRSKTEQQPIYLETSVEKNKRVYERFGFDVYHEWPQPDGTTLYFMRSTFS